MSPSYPSEWEFTGSSWAGPYKPPPPKQAPILTEEQAANKAKWDLRTKNQELFWAMPKVTQAVVLSTVIVLGIELQRQESIEHDFDGHGNTMYITQVRFRVHKVLHGKALRKGQKQTVTLIDLRPLNPPSNGQTIFFLRKQTCDAEWGWAVLAAPSAADHTIDEIESLSHKRKASLSPTGQCATLQNEILKTVLRRPTLNSSSITGPQIPWPTKTEALRPNSFEGRNPKALD